MRLDRCNIWSFDSGRKSMLAVSWQMSSPNCVKLSIPRRYFSGVMINSVPCAWDKCGLLWETSSFSISLGLSIFFHWSLDSDRGILFQGMVSLVGISINLIPLDLYNILFVWCLMERCIFCWYSIIIKLNKYLVCFKLSSSFASYVLSF